MDKIRDFFGKDAACLANKKLFLFDMDGTIYEGETIYEGALELLNIIEQHDRKYVFITNNSSKSVKDYIKKVNRLGISADSDQFFTSVQATILFLKKHYPRELVYCQGTRSFLRELEEAGIRITEETDKDVGVILVGFDMELTTKKLIHTCELLRRGIPFLATNPDLACPVKGGFIPDCGSICKMLENATGRRPVYIGKPERTMVDIVREKYGACAEETVVIGDRLYTDIATGINAGVCTVCVLTGDTTAEEILCTEMKPDFTFESVKNIYQLLVSKL